MFKIVKKQPLNPTVTKMVVEAPLIAKKAHAGQFIILRASEDGERIPLTIAGYDREAGTVTHHFPDCRRERPMELNAAERGRLRFTISWARSASATHTGRPEKGLRSSAAASAAPSRFRWRRRSTSAGAEVHAIVGFRCKDLRDSRGRIHEPASDRLYMMTDDGSYGQQGRRDRRR